MVLGKKVAIFDWEWGRNSASREGQKIDAWVISRREKSLLAGKELLHMLNKAVKRNRVRGRHMLPSSSIMTMCHLVIDQL